jgi:hypothetical protein
LRWRVSCRYCVQAASRPISPTVTNRARACRRLLLVLQMRVGTGTKPVLSSILLYVGQPPYL